MKTKVLIAALVIGALLCCWTVGAEKPVDMTSQKVIYVHYQDNKGDVKEKALTSDAKLSPARGKSQKPAATPTPAQGTDTNPTPTITTPTPAPTATPVESDLYKLKSSKWNQYPVTYYVSPDVAGLSASAVTHEIVEAFNTWDNAVALELCADNAMTTTGQGLFGNGRNEIYWGPMSSTSVVATTAVSWRSTTGVDEADIMLNSLLPWGIDTDGEGTGSVLSGRMDVRNIATHEVGHFLGLADLYDSPAADLTMYGISQYGETKKVSLGSGDLLGIHALYGA